MVVFPFSFGNVVASFPDGYDLGYESNGYIESRPGAAAPIILRLSLHPSTDPPRPADMGPRFVAEEAEKGGHRVHRQGGTVWYYEGESDEYIADDILLRYWKAGRGRWFVGLSATIFASQKDDPIVERTLSEIPGILCSVTDKRKRFWLF